MVECNSFDESGFVGKISTYYSPVTETFETDYVRLQLSHSPSELLSSDSHYLRMRMWREDISGEKVYSSQSASMFFVNRMTGATLRADNQVDYLSKSVIQEVISSNSLSSFGVTVSNFFDRHLIVLTGISFEYDVLQIALFDKSQETATSPVSWVEVLIPAFYADPKDYNAFHQSPALRRLHPYHGQEDNGWTRSQYELSAAQMCQGF